MATSTKVLGPYATSELALLNVYAPEKFTESDYQDTWANVLCGLASRDASQYAPDMEGTTDGDTDGINVLIARADLPSWEKAAEELGCELAESASPVRPGHYGDGQWLGVELAETKDGRLLWNEPEGIG